MADGPDLPGDLLALARADFAAAQVLQDAEGVSDSSTGFHAQQAVEKALKAAIATRGAEFPFTHNLGLLMQLCEDEGLELPETLAESDRLTPYGATLRYGLGDPGTVKPADALRWAELAIEWAASQSAPTDQPNPSEDLE